MSRARLLCITLLLILGAAGCGKRVSVARQAPFSKRSVAQAGLSPAERKLVEKNCYKGMPQTDPAWPHGPTRFVVREGYALQHSSLGKIPLWVCEAVSAEQLLGSAPRKNLFKPDDKLPVGERAELADYKRSGYDRGHMAPAGNQTVDQQIKNETFFLSNMSPQLGTLNQRIWAALEDETRTWVSSRKLVHQITGGFFYDPAEEDPATADGLIKYFVIGNNQVAVPTHFYKILIAKDNTGQDQAIAFVMENKGHPKPYRFADHIRAIRWIEERTGLDFFPELDPGEAKRLERDPAPLWK